MSEHSSDQELIDAIQALLESLDQKPNKLGLINISTSIDEYLGSELKVLEVFGDYNSRKRCFYSGNGKIVLCGFLDGKAWVIIKGNDHTDSKKSGEFTQQQWDKIFNEV